MLLITCLFITLTAAILSRVRVPWTRNAVTLGHMGDAWRAKHGTPLR
jgi:hypothetical protein